MIKRENAGMNGLGIELIRTYSNEGYKIRQIQTGAIYDEAIDVKGSEYTYVETDELIENEDGDVITGKYRYIEIPKETIEEGETNDL